MYKQADGKGFKMAECVKKRVDQIVVIPVNGQQMALGAPQKYSTHPKQPYFKLKEIGRMAWNC